MYDFGNAKNSVWLKPAKANFIRLLDLDKQSEIIQKGKEVENVATEQEKKSKIQDSNAFINNQGLAITNNLTVAGIIEITKTLI